MDSYYTRLVAAIDQCDIEQCDAVAADTVEGLRNAELPPNNIRMQVAGLVTRLSDYYIASGFNESALLPVAFDAASHAYNLTSIEDACRVLSSASEHFCEIINDTKQSIDVRFRQSVSDCIEKHSANQAFSLNYLAALNSYSPSYFSRLFSKVFGMPFSRYLTEHRIERAKRLLMQDSLLLSDVAAKTGFRSASYFCAVFKNETGMSPRQYAADHKQNPNHNSNNASSQYSNNNSNQHSTE
jgi:AraC-like DNA-binding protein